MHIFRKLSQSSHVQTNKTYKNIKNKTKAKIDRIETKIRVNKHFSSLKYIKNNQLNKS